MASQWRRPDITISASQIVKRKKNISRSTRASSASSERTIIIIIIIIMSIKLTGRVQLHPALQIDCDSRLNPAVAALPCAGASTTGWLLMI